jgi:hypothetical protein
MLLGNLLDLVVKRPADQLGLEGQLDLVVMLLEDQ